MSIAALAVAEAAVGAQAEQAAKGNKPPPKRTITAQTDGVVTPEPR